MILMKSCHINYGEKLSSQRVTYAIEFHLRKQKYLYMSFGMVKTQTSIILKYRGLWPLIKSHIQRGLS